MVDVDDMDDEEDGGDEGVELVVAGRQADSKCLFKYDLRANDLKHRGHAKFLSPECVCMCALKLDRSANALPQCAQPYGFSPVCDLR